MSRDAIIAGTALFCKLTLVTRNVDDFRWIAELNMVLSREGQAIVEKAGYVAIR
jgi:hypothetical protein